MTSHATACRDTEPRAETENANVQVKGHFCKITRGNIPMIMVVRDPRVDNICSPVFTGTG